jgi:hypothetical protein
LQAFLCLSYLKFSVLFEVNNPLLFTIVLLSINICVFTKKSSKGLVCLISSQKSVRKRMLP